MKIILEGEPISQSRMRHRSVGNYVMTYDPNAKDKKAVREKLMAYPKQLFNFPRISFVFGMPIPKSLPKSKIKQYQTIITKHVKKPDIDNLIKFYLDCMDGIFFEGDQSVSLGPSYKIYSETPKTLIIITETTEFLPLLETDFPFQASLEFAK